MFLSDCDRDDRGTERLVGSACRSFSSIDRLPTGACSIVGDGNRNAGGRDFAVNSRTNIRSVRVEPWRCRTRIVAVHGSERLWHDISGNRSWSAPALSGQFRWIGSTSICELWRALWSTLRCRSTVRRVSTWSRTRSNTFIALSRRLDCSQLDCSQLGCTRWNSLSYASRAIHVR